MRVEEIAIQVGVGVESVVAWEGHVAAGEGEVVIIIGVQT